MSFSLPPTTGLPTTRTHCGRPNPLLLQHGSSTRKLCITDDILDHPQFQPTRKKNHNNNHHNKKRIMRSAKSFDFEIPMMMGSTTTANLGEKTNELLAMAVSLKDNGMAKIQESWDASQQQYQQQQQQQQQEGIFERDLQKLTYTQRDIQSIVYDDDQAFRTLKASLRQRGCVTNAYLKENIHFYVRHVKDVRQRRVTAERAKQANRQRQRSMRRHAPLNAAA